MLLAVQNVCLVGLLNTCFVKCSFLHFGVRRGEGGEVLRAQKSGVPSPAVLCAVSLLMRFSASLLACVSAC